MFAEDQGSTLIASKKELEYGGSNSDCNDIFRTGIIFFLEMLRRCVSPMLSGYPCLAMKTRSFYYILLESSVKFNTFVLISCRMVAEGLGKLCILTRRRSSEIHKKIF
ncbi:hypothetical protein NPIL_544081 [Nephila pilipes]|uniref:Uncharacterized protein n=1 Tax=Nephila pilipes TaxID=299642 RepID=A0A8X6ID30_NEPPI|nr:hypothetical protein NPIL_544081 [Nephila pilipes]